VAAEAGGVTSEVVLDSSTAAAPGGFYFWRVVDVTNSVTIAQGVEFGETDAKQRIDEQIKVLERYALVGVPSA
jgi:hypothetical protein